MLGLNLARRRRLASATLALPLLTSTLLAPAGYAQTEDEVGPFVPSSARVLQTASADTDGDGTSDIVALYQTQGPGSAPPRVNMLVLRGPRGARQAAQLFGQPPKQEDAPPLVQGGSARLDVRDLNADGRIEVALDLTTPMQGGAARQTLWVWRWDGSTYHLEITLEGASVEVVEPQQAMGPGLRLKSTQHRWDYQSGSMVATEEVYRWQADGYRLSFRSLAFVDQPPAPAWPEAAVLLYYQALGRHDARAAWDLLTTAAQARQSFDQFSAEVRRQRSIYAEEVRSDELRDVETDEPSSSARVYIRFAELDGGSQGAAVQASAGTWTVQRVANGWRLDSSQIAPSYRLGEIAAALPGGTSIEQTAQGDLRAPGSADLAVIAHRPGRFTFAEPVLLFPGDAGLQAQNLAALGVVEDATGAMGGTILLDDVNGDGRAELVFNAGVGAHASLLWVYAWSGTGLRPLFVGTSNTAGVGLEDLDDNGVPEVVVAQSGYCGSYAGSPIAMFVLAWHDGGYQPASADYPTVQTRWVGERAQEALQRATSDTSELGRQAVPCIQHLLATSYAIQARPADALAAYQHYVETVPSSTGEKAPAAFPSYVGSELFEAEVRDLLARAEAGRLGTWQPAQLAILHDLLGNALEDGRQRVAYEQELAQREGRAADAHAATQEIERMTAAATREYQAARQLSPDDREANAGLARLGGS